MTKTWQLRRRLFLRVCEIVTVGAIDTALYVSLRDRSRGFRGTGMRIGQARAMLHPS